jgi:hypothetical protein
MSVGRSVEPGGTSLSCSKNATMSRHSESGMDPGRLRGMLVAMKSYSAAIGLPSHFGVKFGPLSGGSESSPPLASSRWHPPHDLANNFSPRAACATEYTPSHTLWALRAAAGARLAVQQRAVPTRATEIRHITGDSSTRAWDRPSGASA